MIKRDARKTLATAAFAMAVGLGAAGAQAGEDADWLAIVYVWGADITIDARDQSIGTDFSDIVNNLEMGFQGHLEAQGDDFGGFLDVVFMAVGDQDSRPGADLNIDNDLTAADLALVWSPGDERLTGFELYGGLRYISNDFELVVDPIPPILPTVTSSKDASYTDALFGARYIAPLSEHWRLTLQGDLSGGDTEGTWSLGAYAGYRTGPHHFIAGYRHLEMDLESGNVEALTVTFSGPTIAYGFRF